MNFFGSELFSDFEKGSFEKASSFLKNVVNLVQGIRDFPVGRRRNLCHSVPGLNPGAGLRDLKAEKANSFDLQSR